MARNLNGTILVAETDSEQMDGKPRDIHILCVLWRIDVCGAMQVTEETGFRWGLG